MTTIKNRLETVENEVKSLETLMRSADRHKDHVMNLQAQLVAMQKDQKQHLEKLDILLERQQSMLGRQQQQLVNHEKHLLDHDILIANQEKRLERLEELIEENRQGIASMERFNVQTRRIWISMARRMNWDYEDPDLDS